MSEVIQLKSENEARSFFQSLEIPRDALHRKLPEWNRLEKVTTQLAGHGNIEILGWSENSRDRLPLLGFSFGNQDPEAPVLGLYGGVHGLERIGAQVVLSLMSTFSEMLTWDQLLQEALKKIRIVFFPMVNPLGMMNRTRANPRGVDLMRNAPIDAEGTPTWLVGGHRHSNKLPWYRGEFGAALEAESKALIDFTQKESFGSKCVITLDFHSGFGSTDQIWFPYAKNTKPFPNLAEFHALIESYERTHPHHFYQIEPQSKHYTTHGDLWDYLCELYREKHKTDGGVFIPLAVEMGSWMWVKKNPLQAFSTLGAFNPMVPHRHKRILRRHHSLFDFMIRAMVAQKSWIPEKNDHREKHLTKALELWYST